MTTAPANTIFYRYPPKRLMGDYLRAGVGTIFGLAVLVTADTSWGVVLVFGSLTLIFGAFGLRTVSQHRLRVAINELGIYTKGLSTRELPWDALKSMRLRYFGTRRQRKHSGGGFLELKLMGNGNSMTFESSLEGFRDIAWHAAKAARENGVSLDPGTAGNLLQIGIDADSETPRPETDEELSL